MKYNAHIYLCFLFVLMHIACIVNHHFHVFHVARRFYSVNKCCSSVFQLHMITDYVRIVYRVTRWHRLGEN